MMRRGIRLLERLLPPSLLACAVWPFVAVLALQRGVGRSGRSWRKQFRETYGRPVGFLPTWRNFVDKAYVTLALRQADRLGEAAWRNRFVVTGLDALSECHAAGRPVVLAVIHTHHVNLVRLFGTTKGLPIASLTSRAPSAPAADTRAPTTFALSRLRSAYAFLRSGRCLLVACDVPSDDAVVLPTELGTIRVNLGPFRLAAMANALVVPAISWQPRPWRFHLAFGAPMAPPTHASDPAAFRPLAGHCLATWQVVLQNHPEQHNLRHGVWNQPDRPATHPMQTTEMPGPFPRVRGKV